MADYRGLRPMETIRVDNRYRRYKMLNCQFLEITDITAPHADVYGHPEYRYFCKRHKREVIPCIACQEDRCKMYQKKSE